MTQQRHVLTLSLLLLVGCAGASPPPAQPPGASPPRASAPGRDLVSTVPGDHRELRDLMLDAQDRLHALTGVVSDVYGGPTNGPDGTAVLAPVRAGGPFAVAQNGDMFLAAENRVHRVTPTGRVTIVAGYGLHGFADGGSREAYFAGISDLALAPDGSIVVADAGNARLRQITPRP